MYQQFIDDFIQQESLPNSYRDDIERWYLPLTSELEILRQKRRPAPLCLGINGAQGTGKSTLARLLVALLQTRGLRAVSLSIDDFYLSKATREQLADSVHPLLRSRGVPGTHDIALALTTLTALIDAKPNCRVLLPVFDKARDDLLPQAQWREIVTPCDIIILEGWFVGAESQSVEELAAPVNALESEEDIDASWRAYVNSALAGDYQQLFSLLDYLIMLRAPNFDQVYAWRGLQEQKLRAGAAKKAAAGMNDVELMRFIQHFERLTRHCLATLPARADVVFHLDDQHTVSRRTG